MAIEFLEDGRRVFDRMKACPWCQEKVAIKYDDGRFTVTHVKPKSDCPLANGLTYSVEGMSNFYNAIEMWNKRA